MTESACDCLIHPVCLSATCLLTRCFMKKIRPCWSWQKGPKPLWEQFAGKLACSQAAFNSNWLFISRFADKLLPNWLLHQAALPTNCCQSGFASCLFCPEVLVVMSHVAVHAGSRVYKEGSSAASPCPDSRRPRCQFSTDSTKCYRRLPARHVNETPGCCSSC